MYLQFELQFTTCIPVLSRNELLINQINNLILKMKIKLMLVHAWVPPMIYNLTKLGYYQYCIY